MGLEKDETHKMIKMIEKMKSMFDSKCVGHDATEAPVAWRVRHCQRAAVAKLVSGAKCTN